MTTTTPDIFGIDSQAAYMKQLGLDLSRKAASYATDPTSTALNPLSALDTLATSMKASGVPQEYVDAVLALKNDADILAAVDLFQKSLQGKANIHDLKDLVPPLADSETASQGDAGLNGAVLTGQVTPEGETDLIRFSDYLGGSTAGKTFADIPQHFSDLSNGITNMTLFRFQVLQDRLDSLSGDLATLIAEDKVNIKDFATNADTSFREGRGYTVDLDGKVNDASRAKIAASGESPKSKLLHTTFLANVELERQRTKVASRLQAQKILGKIGTGIEAATAGFNVGMGGVNIGAGDEMIQNAERRYARGEISRAEYDQQIQDGRLRIARGTFGIGDGLNSIRKLVMDKVGDSVKNLSKGAKLGLRFASVVGGAFSIGMGVVSITENSIAADRARNSGNIGGAAMYGIMAALDTVSLVLDGVSMVLDCIPGIGTALSFVVDLINTIVGLVNMIIGFFADLVDTRTPEQKLKAALDEHVNSPAFQKYLDQQAQLYKEQGYDLFQFIVDAKAMGLEEEGADGTTVDKEIVRKLSAKALADGNDSNLRLALVDASSIGRELRGRLNDDLIRAGVGNDSVYGEAGDDLLFGDADDDALYGGLGNDYLVGGTGRDSLYGEAGNDWLVVEPGIDIVADGGTGKDTLELSAEFFSLNAGSNPKAIISGYDSINRVYVDLSAQATTTKGRAGLALGALLNGLPALANPLHRPAFPAGSAHETKLINTLFSMSTAQSVAESTLTGKYFWYLANKDGLKYLTDGRYFYAYGTRNGVVGLWKSTYDISTIPSSLAVYDSTNCVMAYTTDGKELEAALVFAFKSTTQISGIEAVCESSGTSPNVFTDVNSQVIGDSSVSLIDLHYGHNEYAYTGNGDTVVSFSAGPSPQWQIWKYIIGGDGDNVLIINGSKWASTTRPNSINVTNKFVLLDHDIDLARANRVPNAANEYVWPANAAENKVDRGIFIKNMQTIQLSNRTYDNTWDSVSFHVDATNLREGHRFIVDSKRDFLRLVGTAGDDSFMLQTVTGEDNQIDGYAGRNLLSLEHFTSSGFVEVDIDAPAFSMGGTLKGTGIKAYLKNIHSVRGNAKVLSIKGHSTQANLLIASGGQCTVEARGGSNTLVAMRGRHKLIGGTGADTYTISGPNIEETAVITVVRDKTAGLIAKAPGGTWSAPSLTLAPLVDDVAEIQLSSPLFLDDNGVRSATGKGTFTVSADKRKLVYTPGSAFNDLPVGESAVVRVVYTTTGSTATIYEASPGNRIKLENIAAKSDLRFAISANGDLRICNASYVTIFTDLRFGELYRSGITSLETLVVDFITRFTSIELFSATPPGIIIEAGEIFDMFFAQLGYSYISNPSIFDNMIDTAKFGGINAFDMLGGDNLILAKRKRATYAASGGNDIFDASSFVDSGTQSETLIKTGNGNDVVIIGNNAETVKVRFIADGQTTKQGIKTLVLKEISVNGVGITQSGAQLTLTVGANTVAILDTSPDVILFKYSWGSILIDDVGAYVTARKAGASYIHRRQYDANRKQALMATDLNRSQVLLHIAFKSYGLDLQLKSGSQVLYGFSMSMTLTPALDALTVARAFQLQFQRGMFFKDGTIDSAGVRAFIMERLRNPSGHSFLGSTTFPNVVDMTQVASPCTVPNGNALIFANKAGTSVTAGTGNNIIKVTASNVTVGTGSPPTDTGDSIVLIQSGLENVTVKLIGQGYTRPFGYRYVIMDGIDSMSVSYFNLNGSALGAGVWSDTPFLMKYGATTIAKFDAVPTWFLFGRGDEYDIIENGVSYLDQRARGTWIQRLVFNRDKLVTMSALDVDSTAFVLSGTWSSSQVTLALKNNAGATLYQFNLAGDSRTTVKSGDVALMIAAKLPGGIRFRDRSYVGDAFVQFLMSKLTSNTIQGVTIQEGAATQTLAQAIAADTTYKKYIDVLAKAQVSVTITNLDP
ncbi:hypothetical protein [Polyangium jinanense]|uniref:Ca2+-binding RTX toxin-like protein n=1 Tax=Polyangium jinanense TaxID=2829994 RepID=A0A9X3X5V0_9BACT|nr:hypothetical protein [Polyangium jinanense]MDC3954366.1 hypothetical protein [Polyangium jinanense]MDC3984182.1 hypothetical protein [Polyangium jinanense]